MATAAIRNLSAIDADIAATKEALKDVHGSETEVYARIVGYYRAVRNWNKGKRDEFDHRKMFVYNDPVQYTVSEADAACECSKAEKISAPSAQVTKNTTAQYGNAAHYEFFMRQTCPNCPPVKNYMSSVSIDGTMIDVDTKDGLAEAAKKGVFAAPTVIVYDANGAEIARGHNVDEVSAILEPATVAAAV